MKNTRKNSLQLSIRWHLCWYRRKQSVHGEFRVIPNKGIEQIARKNDGAGANPKQIRSTSTAAPRDEIDIGDGPLALIGSRTKLMQHWADRIDHWLDPKKAMPIKGGAQA